MLTVECLYTLACSLHLAFDLASLELKPAAVRLAHAVYYHAGSWLDKDVGGRTQVGKDLVLRGQAAVRDRRPAGQGHIINYPPVVCAEACEEAGPA